MSTILSAISYGYRNNEVTWSWEIGSWRVSCGFYRGFGLGFGWMPGEWDVTLGPFALGGVRD